LGLLDGFFSLSRRINKVQDEFAEETREGIVQPLLTELTLDKSDEELIVLKREWEKNWETYEPEIVQKQKENEEYWLGQHFDNHGHTARHGFVSGHHDRPFADKKTG